MKRMKHFWGITLGIALVLMLATSVALADAGDKKSGAFSYRLKGNGTAVITGYDGANEDVYVPRMVDGYTVTEIGDNALSSVGNYIITLPDTITVIGDKAFEGCKASVINIPNSVQSIGDFAFQSCRNIQTVSIPASVERIGTGAFAYCSSIKDFYVDSENAVYATIDGVLFNKQKKELVAFPHNKAAAQYSVPTGIESIGAYAFAGKDEIGYTCMYDIGYFKFADTTKTIGDYAFENATFSDIEKLPDALEHIGNHAFEGATLGLVEFGSNLKTIGDYAFSYAELYTERSDIGGKLNLKLPSTIQRIGEGAFQHVRGDRYKKLFCIDLSRTQIEILEPKTFMGVKQDKQFGMIFLPSSLKHIKEQAFADVETGDISLKNTETIGKRAFASSEVWSLSLGYSNLREIDSEAFYRCCFNGQATLLLPSTVTTIGSEVFKGASGLETITIPASVEKIGEDLCNKANIVLEVEKGSYAELYALENGYQIKREENTDTSWLNN